MTCGTGNENLGSDSENHEDTDNKLDVSTILDISSESDGCDSDKGNSFVLSLNGFSKNF